MVALFILFVGARVGEELARRLGQPALVGGLEGFLVGADVRPPDGRPAPG